MAAMNSFSLLRCSLSVRTLKFIGASNRIPQAAIFPLIRRPLQFRRVFSSARATSDEEAAARAAAVNADSGGPTMFVPFTPANDAMLLSYFPKEVSKFSEVRLKFSAQRVRLIEIDLVFDKIISKEIPSTIVYEDESVLAFRDISPQAPVHVLVIPKLRDGLTELGKAEKRHEEVLGRLLYAAKIVAEKEGISDGFRVVINSGPSACQSVYHLHLHVLGGRQMKWPPG